MKTPHLLTALAAAASAIGYSAYNPTPSIPFKWADDAPKHSAPSSHRARRNKSSDLSQRQIRKNKRRANAAGDKKAFSR
jgi:hypothetical protein